MISGVFEPSRMLTMYYMCFFFHTRFSFDFCCGLWVLQDAEVANFSIYIHSEPGFVFDESTTRSALFYNRQLSNSIKV